MIIDYIDMITNKPLSKKQEESIIEYKNWSYKVKKIRVRIRTIGHILKVIKHVK